MFFVITSMLMDSKFVKDQSNHNFYATYFNFNRVSTKGSKTEKAFFASKMSSL
jgi:hypothetical protein